MENQNWHCSTLKANAKHNLKRYYWWAFLVCLIISLVSGGGSSFSSYSSSSDSAISNILSGTTYTTVTDDSNSTSQSSMTPYELGYVQGYELGYKHCYNGYSYNNPYGDNGYELTDDYSYGYKDGYDAGYMDCFNGNDYDDTVPVEETESETVTSSNPQTFKEYIENVKDNLYSYLQENLNISESQAESFMTFVLILIAAISLLSILFSIFVTDPLIVGQKMFFQTARIENVQFSYLGSAFHKGKYLKTVKTMFVKKLYLFLWSLLFVIPGLVKYFSYALVPYIVAENPDIPANRAIEISKKTMKGEKWHLFVLGLSFIGWYILGALACGIGTLFVVPYVEATYSEFYALMREKAFAYNIASRDELPGFPTKTVTPPPFGNSNGFNNFNNFNNNNFGGNNFNNNDFSGNNFNNNNDFNQSDNPYYNDPDNLQ
jgi:uncharacterized membrane protein